MVSLLSTSRVIVFPVRVFTKICRRKQQKVYKSQFRSKEPAHRMSQEGCTHHDRMTANVYGLTPHTCTHSPSTTQNRPWGALGSRQITKP
eukprot:279280-Pelagomonas_calceolata.AAC.1